MDTQLKSISYLIKARVRVGQLEQSGDGGQQLGRAARLENYATIGHEQRALAVS